MDERKEVFQYTYSAGQQSEIRSIREQYIPKEENKLEQLRKLHHSATKKARTASMILGIIGALVLGTGMSLAMTELSGFLGGTAMFIGIPVGVVGMVLMALAYPVYHRVLTRERERITPEILRLTDELMQ